MDIHVSQTFDCDAPLLWVVLRDPAFQRALSEAAQVDQEVLADDPVPGGRKLRIRVTARTPLPAVAVKALGTERLIWVQENCTQVVSFSMTWSITPNVIPDRIRAEGTMQVTQDSPGRCTRVVRGVVEVNIPVVGKRIERQILADLEKSYERAYKLIVDWLKRPASSKDRQE